MGTRSFIFLSGRLLYFFLGLCDYSDKFPKMFCSSCRMECPSNLMNYEYVHAWSEFLFVSLPLIFNFSPQISQFYYFTSLHGLQDVENHCAHLRDIELKTGAKIPYLRFPYVILYLYNNKINARILIGQSAMVYCAGKPMEKSRVF